MSLPSGYTRLEYIESTGTQYIDTGFKPTGNSKLEVTFQTTQTIGVVIGCDSGWLSNGFMVALNVSSFNTGSNSYSLQDGKKHTVAMESGALTVDGNNVGSAGSGSFTGNATVCLFTNNRSGKKDTPTAQKQWGAKLWENGVLQRDFIPCKNASGTVGMWDDVNSVFYGNAGTGTFTAGPVLAIAANASEITKLEYIESSGTQYVDSGFIPNGESTVEIAFESAVIDPTTSGNYPVYGAASNYNSNAFELWSLAYGFCTYGSQPYKSGFGLSANVKYVSKQAKNVLEINNQTLTFTKQTFSAPYSLLLFATHRDDKITVSGSDAKLKIYFCKIYDNGTLIRDYIAAKLSDGTIGLYDKLHGLLYTNVGTGTFIAGPVVTSPSIFVNIDGIWKPINHIYVNINNIWQKST